jgi:hypothetical protein
MKRRLASIALASVLGLTSFSALALWVLPTPIPTLPGTPEPLPLALMGCALLALGRLLANSQRSEV